MFNLGEFLIKLSYDITNNIGLSTIFLAFFAVLIRAPLKIIKEKVEIFNDIKNIKVKLNSLDGLDKTYEQLENVFFSKKIFPLILYVVYIFIYYSMSIQIFVALLNATDVLNMSSDIKYSFLFIDDILYKGKTFLLPFITSLIMFLRSNIKKLDNVLKENFVLSVLKVAFWGLLFSLYTTFFGQIYILYILSKNVFGFFIDIILRKIMKK